MKLEFPDNLTAEEQAEFTAVNLVAHNVLREQKEARQPCWLCMSDEAKQDARQKAAKWYNENAHPSLPVQEDTALLERLLAPAAEPLMQQWVNTEAEYKRLRVEDRNPQAYFVPA